MDSTFVLKRRNIFNACARHTHQFPLLGCWRVSLYTALYVDAKISPIPHP